MTRDSSHATPGADEEDDDGRLPHLPEAFPEWDVDAQLGYLTASMHRSEIIEVLCELMGYEFDPGLTNQNLTKIELAGVLLELYLKADDLATQRGVSRRSALRISDADFDISYRGSEPGGALRPAEGEGEGEGEDEDEESEPGSADNHIEEVADDLEMFLAGVLVEADDSRLYLRAREIVDDVPRHSKRSIGWGLKRLSDRDPDDRFVCVDRWGGENSMWEVQRQADVEADSA